MTTTTTTAPSITFDERALERVATNNSARSTRSVNSAHSPNPTHTHAQDWTTTTAENDTWAARERRRSSVWSKIDDGPSTTSPSHSRKNSRNTERKGSILSLWSSRVDENGKPIMHHDDHEDVFVDDEKSPRTSPRIQKAKLAVAGTTNPNKERRGSILSLWKSGKDEEGKHVIYDA